MSIRNPQPLLSINNAKLGSKCMACHRQSLSIACTQRAKVLEVKCLIEINPRNYIPTKIERFNTNVASATKLTMSLFFQVPM